MAKFTVHITCDNEAFDGYDGRDLEVARILRSAAGWVEGGFSTKLLKDFNGNTVGFYEYEKD